MPLDGNITADQVTAAAKLFHLAEFMETLETEQVDFRTVHHACGAAHCAWGWGKIIGLFPRSHGNEDDSEWTNEMETAQEGRSLILGLTDKQFRHCFGIGYQFRSLHTGRRGAPSKGDCEGIDRSAQLTGQWSST